MSEKCPNPSKKKWPSQGVAFGAALHSAGKSGKPMSTYHCQCGFWHITSKKRSWSMKRYE